MLVLIVGIPAFVIWQTIKFVNEDTVSDNIKWATASVIRWKNTFYYSLINLWFKGIPTSPFVTESTSIWRK